MFFTKNSTISALSNFDAILERSGKGPKTEAIPSGGLINRSERPGFTCSRSSIDFSDILTSFRRQAGLLKHPVR
jgi:hypothetical protein